MGAGDLPEQLETFSCKVPIDFLSCKLLWKGVIPTDFLSESFPGFPIGLWAGVREAVN